MKKIIALSAVASALFFAGCYDSSSTSNANMPEFAKKSAVIESPKDVTKGLIFIDKNILINNGGFIEYPFSINNFSVSNANPKKLNFILENIQYYNEYLFDRAIDTNCEYFKFQNEESCENGGKLIEIDEIKSKDGKCIVTQTIKSEQCKMRERDENISLNGSQLFNISFLINENGEILDNNKINVNYVMNYAADSISEDDKWDMVNKMNVRLDYSFIDKRMVGLESRIVGSFKLDYFENNVKQISYDFNSNINSIAKAENNAFVIGLNGWAKRKNYRLRENGEERVNYSGIAAENFKVEYSRPYEDERINKITVSGKIGTLCTKGMMSFTTKQPIILRDDEFDRLPVSGKLEVKGTNKADVEFVNDRNLTIKANGETKYYEDWYDVKSDARRNCEIEDMRWIFNEDVRDMWRFIYEILD